MKVNEPSVIVKQEFKQPIEIVWNAITDVTQMRLWFFDNIPAFEARVGFKTEFDVTTEHHTFPHLWEITEVIPKQKIVYNWTNKGFQGDSYITFQLSKKNNQTQLTLTTKVVKNFPDDVLEFKRESCLAGWNYFIKTSLVNYLNNI